MVNQQTLRTYVNNGPLGQDLFLMLYACVISLQFTFSFQRRIQNMHECTDMDAVKKQQRLYCIVQNTKSFYHFAFYSHGTFAVQSQTTTVQAGVG